MTRGGALFCLGTAFLGLAAVDSDLNLLLLLFGLFLGAGFLNALWGWRSLRALSVERVCPDLCVAGQAVELRYSVTNHRVWNSVRGIELSELRPADAAIGPAEAYIERLEPGAAHTVSAPSAALRRGRVELKAVRLSIGFPFGIFRKHLTISQPGEVIVFPALGRLRAEVRPARSFETADGGGARPSRTRGDEEFYGIREYRAGDNPRRIHWRRSAQMRQLMIREMARSRDPIIWCVVDTLTERRSVAQEAALESAVSAAATWLCHALERGTKVGLICGGEPFVVIPPGAGRPRRVRLLRELAIRSPNHDRPLAEQLESRGWPTRWRGTCWLFAVNESPGVRRAAGHLGKSLGRTKVLVPDTPAFNAAFDAPGVPRFQADPANTSGAVRPPVAPRERRSA